MVSTSEDVLRSLPYNYPIDQSCDRSYTFSDPFPEDQRLIDGNITDDIYAGYIGEFEEVDDHRSGKIVIQLNGR